MMNRHLSNIFLFLGLTVFAFSAQAGNLDSIVAFVNDDVITQSELEERVVLLEHTPSLPNAHKAGSMRKRALDALIDRTLEVQIAKRMAINVSDNLVNETITNIAKHNQMSVPQLMQFVKKEGLSEKTYRENVRNNLLVSRLLQRQVGNQVQITPQEIQHFMKNARVSGTQPGITIYQIHDYLASTSQTDALAAKDQWQRGTAPAGTNDLGWRALEQLPAVFVEPIKKMKVGQLSDPIKAPNGFHIVQLVAVRTVAPKGIPATPSVDAEQARQLLHEQKLQALMAPVLKQARARAYIKVMG